MTPDRRCTPRLARVVATLCLASWAVAANAAEPIGIWKLVLMGVGEDDFAIVDLHRSGDQARGVLLDGRRGMFDKATVEDVRLADGSAAFALKGQAMTLKFSGSLMKDGPQAGRLLGTIDVSGNVFPARLEPTRQEKFGPPRRPLVGPEYARARGEQDAKKRVKLFREMAENLHGAPVAYLAYTEILAVADGANLPIAEVDALLAAWRREAEPYGAAWLTEVGIKSLTALAPQKPYAETALKIGRDLEGSFAAEVGTETRQAVARLVAEAARNAGKADAAAEAEARVAAFDAQLDAEYHSKVPPFPTTPYEGRKKPDAGPTVVMELFTGAQCPPCVAADVAFDALLKRYKPDALIGLQYHLHIPRPDPLTNPDALARQEYYGDKIPGTPAVFINGRADRAGGGGPMAMAETRYKDYRQTIDGLLEEKKQVDVTVSAVRTGDEIAIVAEAVLPSANKVDAVKTGKRSSMKLRLALTEESIRYIGSNKLRFHHHVVRALPGGPEGVALVDGRGKVELKLDIAALRKDLEAYVAEESQGQPFFGLTPRVALEGLSVVAFVQDDLDKVILGAATAPAASSAP